MNQGGRGSSFGAWQWLPREVLELFFINVPNSIPCIARQICKASADVFAFANDKVIHLSKPVPPFEFARHWAGADGVRTLTRPQKQLLRRLTASSGSIPNLQFLMSLLGSDPTPDMLAAAAGAGHLDTCAWLRQQGCPWQDQTVAKGDILIAAAGAGHLHVCRWLQQKGGPFVNNGLSAALSAAAEGGHAALCKWLLAVGAKLISGGAAGAARGGHVGLMESLVSRLRAGGEGAETLSTEKVGQLLSAVAAGCELPTLQRAHKEWVEDAGLSLLSLGEKAITGVISGALGSRTPDWRGKVEWLEAAGYPRAWGECCLAITKLPDALERLAWLHQRGCRPCPAMVAHAAEHGAAALLRYCYQAGARLDGCQIAEAGRRFWPVETLQELKALGETLDIGSVLSCAAARANRRIMAWALEQPGAGADVMTSELLTAAAKSGSVRFMAQLRARGCPWSEDAFEAAVESGCEAAVEWVAEGGCPRPGYVMGLYLLAGRLDGCRMLSCLRRLGFALPTGQGMFQQALASRWRLPTLRWLLGQGCKVDWYYARQRAAGCSAEVKGWVEERYEREERQRLARRQGR